MMKWHDRQLIQGGASLLLVLLLAACATPNQTSSISGDSGNAVSSRRYADVINLGGRISVLYQKNGENQAIHSKFTWTQNTQQTTIDLFSPLGQTLAVIQIDAQGASLTEAGKPPHIADNADVLVKQILGWPLPISGLRDWLQGFGTDNRNQAFVAAPDTHFTTQDGWQLSYGDWEHDATHGTAPHPKRIDLSRATEQAGIVEIRLVIDEWHS